MGNEWGCPCTYMHCEWICDGNVMETGYGMGMNVKDGYIMDSILTRV